MKRQKGRKPRKSWHRGGEARRQEEATRHWPTVKADHDGAPTALPQGNIKRRGMTS